MNTCTLHFPSWNVSLTPHLAAFSSPSRECEKHWLYFAPLECRRIQREQSVRAKSREERGMLKALAAADVVEASPPRRGRKRGSSISGPKKTGRKKKNEDTKNGTGSVIHEEKTRRRGKSKEKELVMSDNEKELVMSDNEENAEINRFLEYQGEDLEVEENGKGNGSKFENNWPPLVCCFGAAQSNFTPISARHIAPGILATPKGLQCNPADFVRARGGPPSNVAIKLAKLGGRVALMGKVGNDAYGRQMVIALNMNNVQTRGVRVDPLSSTSVSYVKLKHQDGKLGMMSIQPSAEDSFLVSDIDVDVLREARMFHFTSMALLTKSMRLTLLAAIKFSKKCGGVIFFDVNLPLPLWGPHDEETRQIIQAAWNYSNVIEVTNRELEFLIDKGYVGNKRATTDPDGNMKPLHYHHYTREELSPLWHDDLKLLLVHDGANLHYYTPSFDDYLSGGMEDVNFTGFTCDRSASNDTFIAGIMKRLVMEPELYSHHLHLGKVIKHVTTSAIAAQGIVPYAKKYATDSQEYIKKKNI